jgi:hypothetical protein
VPQIKTYDAGENIDRFIVEIAASKKFAEAAATDTIWTQRLDDMEKALRSLWRLGDEDVRALDLSDEALRIIQSDEPMKARLLAIHKILVRGSQIFDPVAWGGVVGQQIPAGGKA